MANTIVNKYKKALLEGAANVSLTGGQVKLVLVDTGTYTYADTHEFLVSVAAGARVSTSSALTNPTVTITGVDAYFDSDAVVFAGLTGNSIEAAYLFYDTGNENTSSLIAWFDTVTGFTYDPNGATLTITPHADGWIKI